MKILAKHFLVLFLLLFSFVPFLWLSGNQLILGYDVVFPLKAPAFLIDRMYSWTTVGGFDMDQSGIQGSIIIHFIDSIVLLLGGDPQLAQKLTFSFWFFAMLFSAFIFISKVEKLGYVSNKYAKYFFPILYTFNFYILQGWWAAERTKFSLVVALPLILAIIFPFIEGNLSRKTIIRSSLLTAFTLFIFNGGGWVGMPLYGGLLVSLSCFLLFCGFTFYLRRNYRDIVSLIVYAGASVLFYALFIAYSLIPFLLTTLREYDSIVQGAGGISGVIEWTKYISRDVSYLNLFRFQGIPDWYNSGANHPYAATYISDPVFIVTSYLFPVLLLITLLRKQDRKIKLFFLFLLLVSLFFTSGIHRPLGFFFELLMRAVPGFAVFRSAFFKFGYAYWFAGGFLLALVLGEFVQFVVKRIHIVSLRVIIGILLTCSVMTLLAAYHFPYFTGDIFRVDAAPVGTRVNLPKYVKDFSEWWDKNGGSSRVLLLPRLNEVWAFEQYNWRYMSTSPILGNFSNKNTVENVNILSSDEKALVDNLYIAINNKDFSTTDTLLQVLGIKYLLVRKDFYFNYLDQETDDPRKVEEDMVQNSKVKKVKDFGEWVLYEHQENPIIFTKTNAIWSLGSATIENLLIDNNPLSFNKQVNPSSISDVVIQPHCLNCTLEKEDLSLHIPKPRIFIDSTLFQLLELSYRLSRPSNQSIDGEIGDLLGHTLQMSGQINELLIENKGEEYIAQARDLLVSDLGVISKKIPLVIAKSSDPYRTFFTIQQYLLAEDRFFNALIATRAERRSIFVMLEGVVQELNRVNDQIKNHFPDDDITTTKRYTYTSPDSSPYLLKIKKSTMGELVNPDLSAISLSIDNQLASFSAKVEGDYINFGSINLTKGLHSLILRGPNQKNLLPQGTIEQLAGKTCKSYVFDDFSSLKKYSLRFQSRNNFDPSFYLFIDNGNTYSPVHKTFFPISRDQVNMNRIIISTNKISLQRNSRILRVAFCADTLNETLFQENISDLSLVELTTPAIVLSKKNNIVSSQAPSISFVEKNQTQYSVHVSNINGPFYLVFSKHFSSGWKSSVGEHLLGNKFANVWYIDSSQKSLDIDLWYSPQRYFFAGLIVTILSLVAGAWIYKRL